MKSYKEEAKTRRLGPRHKQKLTNKQIHEQLVSQGHDVGRVTINNAIARLRKRLKEVYIRQQYDFGERLEYDFSEMLLDCGKGIHKYHMAVFSSPASNFKWAYSDNICQGNLSNIKKCWLLLALQLCEKHRP